jgi:hypothetical protein
MLYSEINAVCSHIHTKHINALCGQNVPRSKHAQSSFLTAICRLLVIKSKVKLCPVKQVPRSKSYSWVTNSKAPRVLGALYSVF